jgi:hypothetical protein
MPDIRKPALDHGGLSKGVFRGGSFHGWEDCSSLVAEWS